LEGERLPSGAIPRGLSPLDSKRFSALRVQRFDATLTDISRQFECARPLPARSNLRQTRGTSDSPCGDHRTTIAAAAARGGPSEGTCSGEPYATNPLSGLLRTPLLMFALRFHFILFFNTNGRLGDQPCSECSLLLRSLPFPKLRPVGGRLVSFQIWQRTRMRC
jgi:hypothetical protein